MNPENNVPLNYLDEIAPVQHKESFLDGKIKKLIGFGALAIVLVIMLSIFASSLSGNRKNDWTELSLNLKNTSSIVSNGKTSIKSNKLRSINSEISIFIVNTENDITPYLEELKITEKNIPESTKNRLSVASTIERLEDANLNAVYDRTYTREMAFQLSQLLNSLQKTYKSTKSEGAKEFLSTSYDNLESSYNSLVDFDKI